SGFVPEPGDIAVWGADLNSSGTGHVAIVLSANENSFVSMDQNWPQGSACKQVTHTYNKFWGVIRPNFDEIGNNPEGITAYGFDSPTEGEVIARDVWQFSGWVRTTKSIDSIT